jgi:AraC-like DNA-binding protein
LARQLESDLSASGPHVPRDLRLAVKMMRAAMEEPRSMAELAERCGVAERTLSKHFQAYLGMSPMRYQRRLRLAAARDALLSGMPGMSVTEVAKQFAFNHLGRFSEQYRSQFGESPSTTLRLGRAAVRLSGSMPLRYEAKPLSKDFSASQAPRPSREKPSIAILPCRTSPNMPGLVWVAESLARPQCEILPDWADCLRGLAASSKPLRC